MRDIQPDLPAPGDVIWIRRRQWRVQHTHAGTGLARVLVQRWPTALTRTFLLPCEQWSRDAPRRSRPSSPQRALAWLAGCAARVHPAFTPSSIVTSRTSLLAYQLEPALAILAGTRRVLIADAVGLGKTIQAALIIAEVLRRIADARILVLAPAPLLPQWLEELQARFDVTAHIADADHFARLRTDLHYLGSPWLNPGVWVASPDYVKQPHVIEALPHAPFDAVIIDEAHTTAGHSQRHLAIDAIARSARRVVMLTATPHDGDAARFNRLVSLGATGAPADALRIFRRTRARPPRRIRRLAVPPGPGLSQVLAAIDSFERAGRSGLSNEGLHLVCAVFRKRALSSMAALTSSIHRRLAVLHDARAPETTDSWTQPELTFGDDGARGPDEGDVMSADEWSALRGLTGLPKAREEAWLQRLLAAGARASAHAAGDPKLARLASLLSRSPEPVVVFTEYRDSLIAVEGALAGSRRVSVLHGGLTGAEQRRALSAFLDGRTNTLLATDVASQGLNLQHRARWVVHFDLPWTPTRLEQRVGRVDRIGQTRPVHVTAIGIRHSAEAALRRRVEARQDASEAAPLPNCTRWSRAAEGLARLFARQRALAARWRGPDPMAVPRARVTAGTLQRLFRDATSPATVVEIPIVSSTGEVVERHIGWLAGAGRLVGRARALDARARRRAARLLAAQAAPAGAPRQPGLFDKPGLAAPPARDDEGALPPEETVSPAVHVGTPHPLLILEARR